MFRLYKRQGYNNTGCTAISSGEFIGHLIGPNILEIINIDGTTAKPLI